MTLPPKIARRGFSDYLLAAEALLLLVLFRVCLAMVPVRRIIHAITPARAKPRDKNAPERDIQQARRVEWAVSAAARHSFVEFVCFPQTLAGYVMLRRRGVPSTMVYGVARANGADLIAHTWLMVGEKIVTGGEGAEEFSPLERWG